MAWIVAAVLTPIILLLGVTSTKGPLRTLKAADRQSGSSLDPEASVANVRFSDRQRD
jgi:hypothetical protein